MTAGAVDRGCRMSAVHVTMEAAKNKRPGPPTAPTVGTWPGSRRPSDSEERKRLMTSMPVPPDNGLPCTNPHVDGCDHCVVNSEVPQRVDTTERGCLCEYRCTDCGYEWQTAWGCS